MADQRTMTQLFQAPTEGYEDAIVFPAIIADNFEIKHGLFTLVQNKHEAWDRFKDLFRACPHHSFSKLHQLDTFYNALNSKHQDSLNSVAGGNFLDKMPRECLTIIDSKSKVRYSCNKPVVAKVSTNTSTFGISPDVAELKDMVKALLLDKKSQSPAPMKVVEESFVTCGGSHSYRNFPATDGNVYRDNIQEFVSQASTVNYNQGNTIYRPLMMSNQIRPLGFPPIPPLTSFLPKVVENEPEATKDTVNPTNNESTKDVQPQPNPTTSIPYPSRRNDERNPEKANNQIEKFYQIFKDMSFEISFADALILMPKFSSTPKALIRNKEKFSEMAQTPLNEHCSAVLLKKLPKKLGDPGKFLIPCDFPGMAECLALAFLGASIKLMPFFMWKKLSLPDLTPTCMTFELADHLISRPVGVAEDVYVKVGSFHFSADFVVVDFDADPRVPLILRRSFLKTRRALIDVFEGELTLRVGKEAITFNVDQTSSYSANYSDKPAKRIDVIDMACEEYSQEVLGFSDTISSGNPALYYDPIVSTTSLTLSETPYLDPEGDILLLEAFLNDDPSSPSPSQGNYLLEVRKELKICEAKSDKSSVDEPLEDLEKTTFTCPYETFAYRRMPFGLCNAPGTFQRCMMAMFHDMIEKTMEVFMDDFFVFRNSFQSCLSHLERMLKRYEDTNLCQNWEKSHFMVKEGIVLGNKISKQRIKVDKAKLDVITKLPHPTNVKECVMAFQTLKRKLTEAPILIALDWNMPFELMCDASDYAIGAVLGQRQDKHFRPIHYASKTMIEAESKYTTTEKEMLAVVYAFEKFQSYLIMNKIIVYTDHSALKMTPICLKFVLIKSSEGVYLVRKPLKSSRLAIMDLHETSGQVEVSNRGLQRILERAVGENHASWLDKLDYARWAFRTAYKTPIGCTPYKLLYEKACHLLVELEHKAY
nr:retrovirus-related Pol polyprotein from transposon 17.6 [Tanacetum cinerariifolium]